MSSSNTSRRRIAAHQCVRCACPLDPAYRFQRCVACVQHYKERRKLLAEGKATKLVSLWNPQPGTPSAKDLIAQWHARPYDHVAAPTELLV